MPTNHCSNSWYCRASNQALLSFKQHGNHAASDSWETPKGDFHFPGQLPHSACQAQCGDAILAPKRRAKEQIPCL